MNSIQNWFAGGSAPDKEPAPQTSLLSDWNKYSSSDPAANSQALSAAEEGAPIAEGGGFFSSVYTSLTSAASGAAESYQK